MTAAASSRGGSGITERVVLLFLVAASLVLGWIYFRVMPSERDARRPAVRPHATRCSTRGSGECVQIESTSDAGRRRLPEGARAGCRAATAERARASSGSTADLRREPGPTSRRLSAIRRPGKGCEEASDAARGRSSSSTSTRSACPTAWTSRWTPSARSGCSAAGASCSSTRSSSRSTAPFGRTWFVDVHPDAPVTGIVRRQAHRARAARRPRSSSGLDDCP